MRFAFRQVTVRVAVAVAAAGLISAPAGTAFAASAGCTWELTTSAVPEGFTDVNTSEAGGKYFTGSGSGPDGSVPLLWSDLGKSVRVLKTPSGGSGHAVGVNRHGVVVGNDSQADRPFIWTRDRARTLAVPAGTTSAGVSGINDAGTIIGWAIVGEQQHGLVWSARTPGRYRDLGTGDGWLGLSDIDQDGTIVGFTLADEYAHRRALKGTVEQGLSPLIEGDDISESHAGSISGDYILGNATFFDGTLYNYSNLVWHGDTYTKMPLNYSLVDVNSSGLVAGAEYHDTGEVHSQRGSVWKDGVSTVLPVTHPGTRAFPSAVTESGVVIGTNTVPGSEDDGDFPTNVPVTWTCS